MTVPHGEAADSKELLAVIGQLSDNAPEGTLANLGDAIAALPDDADVQSCAGALCARTGKALLHLIGLSPALGERTAAWALQQAGEEADTLLAEIKTVGREGPPTDGQRAELCRRIAELPDETARKHLIHALARRLKFSPKTIARQVAECRGDGQEGADGGTATSRQRIRDLLDTTGSGAPDGLLLPVNYVIEKTGEIARSSTGGNTTTSTVPILITQTLTYPGADTIRHRVAFRLYNAATDSHEWRSMMADPAHLFDGRKIMGLTNHRLPVTTDLAPELAGWLSNLALANHGIIPEVTGIPVAGWYWPGMKVDEGGAQAGGPSPGSDPPGLDQAMFLWGRLCITRDGVVQDGTVRLEAPEGDAITLQEAMHQRGSLQGWLDTTWPIVRERPVARVRLYASLASALVRLCGGSGHVNHNGGHTTLGKTVVAQWAMSPWGNPGGPGMPDGPALMRSWDMTKVGAERTFGFLNDIPAYLDDDPRTRGGQDQSNQQRVQDIVMTLANGVGRVRGAPDSKILVTRHWHLNVISTNEQAIRDIVGRDGAMVRVLDLWGSPLVRVVDGRTVEESEEELRQVSEGLRSATAQNYGWAPDYIKAVMGFGRDRLIRLLDAARDGLLEDLKRERVDIGRLEARQMAYWALMMVAAVVFHLKVCHGHPLAGGEAALEEASAAVRWVIEKSVQANPIKPTDEEVYDQMLAWALALKNSFYGHWEGQGDEEGGAAPRYAPTGGWCGKWHVTATVGGKRVQCIGIMPHRFHEAVSKMGQSPDTMLRLWADRGLLLTQGKHRSRVVVLDNWREGVRMYVLVWREATADVEREEEPPERLRF